MRNIVKNIELPVNGENQSFRITKWDALSSICLLRLANCFMLKHMDCLKFSALAENVFQNMPEQDLKSVSVAALNHVEMLLPAGYQPVMTGSEWGIADLEYDGKTCLKLALESCAWTLRDFFTEGDSKSPKKTSASSQ